MNAKNDAIKSFVTSQPKGHEGSGIAMAAFCIAIAIFVVSSLCPALSGTSASAASFDATVASVSADDASCTKVLTAKNRTRSIVRAKAFKIKTVTYTGRAVKPVPKLAYSGKRLMAGRDYKLSYKSNINAGTAKIIVVGKGFYVGRKVLAFKIAKARVSKLNVSKLKEKTYTGNPVNASPAVSYNGKSLKKGSDYTLSYKSNVNAGMATVKIIGRGNYSGLRKVRFEIVPASLDKAKVSSIAPMSTTGLSAVKPKPEVKLGKRVLAKGSDYKISYKNNVLPGTATVVIKAKSRNFTGKAIRNFKLANLGDDLARKACGLSYSRKVKGGKGTKEYRDSCKAVGCYSSPYYGRSCALAMCTVIRSSGYDTGFPKYNWDKRWAVKSVRSYFHYLQKGEVSSDVSQRSPRWTYVGTYPEDESKLLPGDVLLVIHGNGKSSNHVWMYVGEEIARDVYDSCLAGTDADKGAPTGAWVQAHAYNKSAPSIEGPNNNYSKSPNPVRIYRCTSPENK